MIPSNSYNKRYEGQRGLLRIIETMKQTNRSFAQRQKIKARELLTILFLRKVRNRIY